MRFVINKGEYSLYFVILLCETTITASVFSPSVCNSGFILQSYKVAVTNGKS